MDIRLELVVHKEQYNEFYRAIFKLNDIYFDLETKDEKEELIKIVKNISS